MIPLAQQYVSKKQANFVAELLLVVVQNQTLREVCPLPAPRNTRLRHHTCRLCLKSYRCAVRAQAHPSDGSPGPKAPTFLRKAEICPAARGERPREDRRSGFPMETPVQLSPYCPPTCRSSQGRRFRAAPTGTAAPRRAGTSQRLHPPGQEAAAL